MFVCKTNYNKNYVCNVSVNNISVSYSYAKDLTKQLITTVLCLNGLYLNKKKLATNFDANCNYCLT